jgi:hypothetical protein
MTPFLAMRVVMRLSECWHLVHSTGLSELERSDAQRIFLQELLKEKQGWARTSSRRGWSAGPLYS